MIMLRRILALAATATVALAIAGVAGASTPAAAGTSSLSSWITSAIHLSGAQQEATGSGVTVAVIDTGTADLPQFAGHLTEGPSYVSAGSAPGQEDHGTGMAELVLQVAPQAHILAIRAIAGDGATTAKDLNNCTIGSAIDYAITHGAKVISMSLGDATGDLIGYSGCQAQAVERALSAGITVLAAAGNNGFTDDFFQFGGGDGDDDESFPAGYTGVIAVGALAQSGARAYFSTVHSFVDVGAPGVNIPTIDETGAPTITQGTSDSTPLVAGIAALILSKKPGLAPYQVAAAIEKTASNPGNWNPETGYGEVNATAALAAAEQMTPASATQSSVSYAGGTDFGNAGGSGSSASTTDVGGYVHAGILFVLALLSLTGVFFLVRRRRTTTA
jgi:subtilisin family serine protease